MNAVETQAPYDVTYNVYVYGDLDEHEANLKSDDGQDATEVSYLGEKFWITEVKGNFEMYKTDLLIILENDKRELKMVMKEEGYGRRQWARIGNMPKVDVGDWEGTGTLDDSFSLMFATLVEFLEKEYIRLGYVTEDFKLNQDKLTNQKLVEVYEKFVESDYDFPVVVHNLHPGWWDEWGNRIRGLEFDGTVTLKNGTKAKVTFDTRRYEKEYSQFFRTNFKVEATLVIDGKYKTRSLGPLKSLIKRLK